MSKREEIIDKSVELFSKYGYENVGVQEIVKSCNVTKPTLYHYFGSKAGLLEEISKTKILPFIGLLNVKAKYNRDINKNIRDVVKLYFDFAKKNTMICKLIIISNALPLESEAQLVLEPYLSKQIEILKVMFSEAVEDNGNMRGREYRYSASFLGTINTYLLMYFKNAIELSDEDVYKLTHQFMHGIFS